ncbi:MAG TPA: hypothetical protein VJO52_07900 [Gemmatimonadaceae bacterium]|nr:hypothetical protein [Gemmatimonadaceae bacterium]
MDAAWIVVRDALLRGLTHALSNRVMAIATLADLTAEAPPSDATNDVLASEARRLDALLHQFRLLSPAPPAPAEPLNIADTLPALVELAGRHPEVAGMPCDIRVAATVQPAYTDAGMLGRVVPPLVVAATRAARRVGASRVQIDVSGDAHWVVVRLAVGDAGVAEGTADVASQGSPAMQIADTGHGARYELLLPTLAAARRRDRSAS